MTENRNRIVDPKLFYGFCAAELILLVVLKLVQTAYPQSVAKTYLMFSATLLNTLAVLFIVLCVKRAGKATVITGIPLAAFTTLLADCFLVLAKDLARADEIGFISAKNAETIGFFVFGMVQVVYAAYLGITKRRLIIRIGFYLAFVAAVYAIGMLTFGRFIACLSMTQLILNLIYAWIEHGKRHTRGSLLFGIGITLFLVGDSLIMLRMLLPSGELAYEIVRFLVWVFYIPTQVVLTASYLADRTDA